MKKQLQIFLTREYESTLSELLKVDLPELCFLNDNVWSERPDCRDGIEDCDSGRVYLYAGSLESLPMVQRRSGELEGPVAGCVVQVLRSTTNVDGTLLSGRVAAGINDDDAHIQQFISKVWNCLAKVGRIGAVRPDGHVDKNYLVGHAATRGVAAAGLAIADRATGICYKPVQ